jgi:hypothetical protein
VLIEDFLFKTFAGIVVIPGSEKKIMKFLFTTTECAQLWRAQSIGPPSQTLILDCRCWFVEQARSLYVPIFFGSRMLMCRHYATARAHLVSDISSTSLYSSINTCLIYRGTAMLFLLVESRLFLLRREGLVLSHWLGYLQRLLHDRSGRNTFARAFVASARWWL